MALCVKFKRFREEIVWRHSLTKLLLGIRNNTRTTDEKILEDLIRMGFENEYTLKNYLKSKDERIFHESYEKALKDIKSRFGKKYSMIINGKHYNSSETFIDTSPIDKRIRLGYFPLATSKHVRTAIKAAKTAFEKWGKANYESRIDICYTAADIISKRKFELAAWISYENGKNRYEAIADVDEAIDFIRYYSKEMERNKGFAVQTKNAGSNERSKSLMKPYGVWAVISPFNFPFAILAGMSIAVIVTGNTVVLKPASDTPIIGSLFVEIMKKAGLPDGVLNLVTGSGGKIGKAIVASRDVAGIVFTGSKMVGHKIMEDSSNVIPRPVIAELGGKNPVIVTENADINKAAEGIIKAAFGYSGQKCSACSRVYVQKNIKKLLMQKLVEKTRNFSIGNPLDQDVFMGPLINLNAYTNYQKFAKIAFRDGRVIFGGTVNRQGNLKHGYYVEPTIVEDLPKSHMLFKEELFVPILCIAAYKDFDEALKLCNESEYGLTSGIYSTKKEEIDRFLDNSKSGVVYVNRTASATTGAMVGSQPFGGWKDSGTTGKGAGGPYYLTQFLREQSQTVVT
ncbi:MAG: aldehyde dehydrogenase family protein [Nitrososphaeraceae archaeon]